MVGVFCRSNYNSIDAFVRITVVLNKNIICEFSDVKKGHHVLSDVLDDSQFPLLQVKFLNGK